jgi:hypothetical protein
MSGVDTREDVVVQPKSAEPREEVDFSQALHTRATGRSVRFMYLDDRCTRTGSGRPLTQPDAVLADKAYRSKADQTHLRRRGASIRSATDQDVRHRRHRKMAPTPTETWA